MIQMHGLLAETCSFRQAGDNFTQLKPPAFFIDNDFRLKYGILQGEKPFMQVSVKRIEQLSTLEKKFVITVTFYNVV